MPLMYSFMMKHMNGKMASYASDFCEMEISVLEDC
jgi:hypothetical protein